MLRLLLWNRLAHTKDGGDPLRHVLAQAKRRAVSDIQELLKDRSTVRSLKLSETIRLGG